MSNAEEEGDTYRVDSNEPNISAIQNQQQSHRVFQSNIPRPASVARSGSSSSSTGGRVNGKNTRQDNTDSGVKNRSKTTNYTSDDNSSSNAEEEENLLASFLNSGISKSKSEPLSLKSSAHTKKSKKQSKTAKKYIPRPKSKSPRNSTIIPGVRQTHLRLIPTSPLDSSKSPNWCETKTKMTLPISSHQQMAVSDIWTDESPNIARGPSIEDEVSKKMEYLNTNECETQNQTMGHEETKPSSTVDNDTNTEKDIVSYVSSLEDTLTASRVLELEANRVAQSVVVSQPYEQHYINTGCQRQPFSMADSVCSNLSGIQPPSVMDSLISISGGNGDFLYLTSNVVPQTSTSSGSSNIFTNSKEGENLNVHTSLSQNEQKPIECRHTLGAKKGSFVPELVRRALGGVSNSQNLNTLGSSTISTSYYDDLTSSISSCQSNLDNIKPPTIMDDQRFMDQMDNSILSIASISSEIAPTDGLERSTGSGKLSSYDMTSSNGESNEITIKGNEHVNFYVTEPSTNAFQEEPISEACCTALEDIAPPTLMDDVSGCTKTLVAEMPPKAQDRREEHDSDQTYTIQGRRL